ncbi:MAG: ribonuclease P protein component [Chromatiales bacterium]|nr:ribonuclease P protein component [Chromatiales bacterium]
MTDIKACFPKTVRLNGAADFSQVFSKPQRSVDSYFTILFRRNNSGLARLGLAIAKKNLKRAVDRNLVKRIIRESFRVHQRELAGLDIVVLSRKGMSLKERAALHASLEKHWSRLAKQSAKS